MVVDKLIKVIGLWVKDFEVKVVQVIVGYIFLFFFIFIGQVYVFGLSEFGQFGNGKIGECFVKVGKIVYDIEVFFCKILIFEILYLY